MRSLDDHLNSNRLPTDVTEKGSNGDVQLLCTYVQVTGPGGSGQWNNLLDHWIRSCGRFPRGLQPDRKADIDHKNINGHERIVTGTGRLIRSRSSNQRGALTGNAEEGGTSHNVAKTQVLRCTHRTWFRHWPPRNERCLLRNEEPRQPSQRDDSLSS